MMNPIQMAMVRDSLQNIITGLGTDRDKVTANYHRFVPLSYGQLLAAYRGSWVHRKVVDIPADDATRNWRTWKGESAQVRAVENLEERLMVRNHVNLAIKVARLYGGAGIILVFDDGVDPIEPLEKVEKGQLVHLRVLENTHLQASDIYDVTIGPEWFRMSTGTPIHVSRMSRIIPRPIPDSFIREEWGDSILQSVHQEANFVLSVVQSLAHLVSEAKVDIIKIKDFVSQLGNEDFQNNLIKRFMNINQMKSMVNAHILDSEDSWERTSTATEFGNIPSATDTFLNIVAAAADIPMTRFVGTSPGGLNATGESDIRNYYDSIRSDQDNLYSNALLPLDRALVHSALGEWPAGLTYEWNSLWQETEQERVDRANALTTIFAQDVASGVFTDEELRAMRIAQLAELGIYPNVEAATGTEQDIEEELDEDDEDIRNQFNQTKNIPSYDPIFSARAPAVKRAGTV